MCTHRNPLICITRYRYRYNDNDNDIEILYYLGVFLRKKKPIKPSSSTNPITIGKEQIYSYKAALDLLTARSTYSSKDRLVHGLLMLTNGNVVEIHGSIISKYDSSTDTLFVTNANRGSIDTTS